MSLEDLTTDQLLAHTRALEAKNALYEPLMRDPSTRQEMLRLLRVKNPTMPIPELDVRAELDKKLDEERAKREALEQRLMSERIDRDISDQRTRVKSQYGLTDEDLAAVEKMMVDDKIGTWDGAAKVFKASRSQAVPTPSTISAPIYDMPSKEKWGPGVGNKVNLNRIAMKEAFAALDDINSGRVKVA